MMMFWREEIAVEIVFEIEEITLLHYFIPTSVLLGDNSCVVEPSMASSPVTITEGFLGGFGLGLVMGGATLPLLVKKSRTRDKRSSWLSWFAFSSLALSPSTCETSVCACVYVYVCMRVAAQTDVTTVGESTLRLTTELQFCCTHNLLKTLVGS